MKKFIKAAQFSKKFNWNKSQRKECIIMGLELGLI